MIQKLDFALFERERMERPEIEDLLGISIGSGGQLRSDSRGLSSAPTTNTWNASRATSISCGRKVLRNSSRATAGFHPRAAPRAGRNGELIYRGSITHAQVQCRASIPLPSSALSNLGIAGFEFPVGGFMPEKKSLLSRVSTTRTSIFRRPCRSKEVRLCNVLPSCTRSRREVAPG